MQFYWNTWMYTLWECVHFVDPCCKATVLVMDTAVLTVELNTFLHLLYTLFDNYEDL